MKKTIILIVITLVIGLAYSSCVYNKADLVYPQPPVCDTINMKYSTDIVPILTANCYVCHAGSASGSFGRKFDAHNLLMPYVNSGKLVKSISHASGATPMPYQLPKLPQCTIDKIKAWVDRGAPNN